MDMQHVNAKVFVDGDLKVDPAHFIDVFHEWIRDGRFDELLIDVADYRHVPAGPGVMLIALEGDYSMDHAGSHWGMRYNRKAPLDGNNEDRLRQALRSTLTACQLLEEHFAADGPLNFSRTAFELFINDRALAPNTPETLEECTPQLTAFLSKTLGHDQFTLEPRPDPRSLFGVTVTTAKPFDPAAILNTLHADA